MTNSDDALVLEIAAYMEDLVAHGVAGVDRSVTPAEYWLHPEDEMTPEAQEYWKKKLAQRAEQLPAAPPG